MSFTPRLDRLDAMQRAPLGTYSPLNKPSPVASQYRRQAEMYGQALRTLTRAARRGDPKAAITAIGLRDQANANGFTPGGIGSSEGKMGAIAGREQQMGQSALDFEEAAGLNRGTGMMGGKTVLGKGDGSSPQNAAASSTGGQWVNVGGDPAPNPNGTTTPLSNPLNPSGGDPLLRRAKSYRVAELTAKWANEARANNPDRMQADYERANGTPKEQTDAYNARYGQSEAKVERAISNLDPSKFSPEQIAAIRKNMSDIGEEGRLEASNAGASAAADYGQRLDRGINRAKGVVAEVQNEALRRKGVVEGLQREVADARQGNREIMSRPMPQEVPVQPTAPTATPTQALPQSSEAGLSRPISPSGEMISTGLQRYVPGAMTPYQAVQSLQELHGYTKKQAEEIVKSRGITLEAYNDRLKKAREAQRERDKVNQRTPSTRPKLLDRVFGRQPEFLRGTAAGSLYESINK